MNNLLELVNTLATVWSLWMTQMAWQVTILAGVVWMVTRVFRRAPASLRHLLWMAVILKLMISPFLAAPWSLGQWFPEGLHTATLSAPPAVVMPPEPTPVEALTQQAAVPATPTDATNTAASMAPGLTTKVETSTSLTVQAMAMLGWAVGASIFLGGILVQYGRFSRRVRRGMGPASPTIEAMVREQSQLLGIRRAVQVLLSPHVSTPAVFGVIRPRVLLPVGFEKSFDRTELEAILAHELAHVKRHDIPMAWLVSLLSAVYWFHPILWVAVLHLRREREMACDDLVLARTRQDGKAYASVILRTAESFDGAVPAGAGFLGLIELADNLLHRIRSAGDPRCHRRLTYAWAVPLVAVALFLVPMGVLAASADTGPYASASAKVQQFVAKVMQREELWIPDGAFENLTAAEREAKVTACLEALQGEYGRALCPALAEAGALADPRLKPALLAIATHRLGERADNRPRWMAVAALGRLDDISVAPTLIRLVDYYNRDTAVFAQAGLARLTGEDFGADKEAWGGWWNASGNAPKLTAEDLTPSESPASRQESSLKAPTSAEVQQFVARVMQREELWIPDGAFDKLTAAEREAKVTACLETLQGDYGRALCPALAEAGALADPRLKPALLAIATHRLGERADNRPRWMAVAALGRLDDISVAPTLIRLVDYYNRDTAVFAQAGLARLTGEDFGADKEAWGAWWNASGNTPKLSAEDLTPSEPPTSRQERSLKAPEIVSTSPAIGASEVDPGTKELRVTFDQDMGKGFSWTGGGPRFPETTGKPAWETQRTCVLPVALEAGKVYRVGINAKSYQNFRGTNGAPARHRVLYFATKGADPKELEALVPPEVVSLSPVQGAKDVSPGQGELRVTFNKPMGAGFSWVQFDPATYPESSGSPVWSEERTVCTLPVRLAPGRSYAVGLNSDRFINFQSASGVPLEPVVWEFACGGEQ